MFSHNFKQILRSLWRFKSFTIINVLGLSIGIAAVALIFLIADFENSFDEQHSAGNHLYRVISNEPTENKESFSAAVPYPTAKFLRSEYGDAIVTQTHFSKDMNVQIANNDPFEEENVLFADSLFFRVLDFASIKNFWITGNPSTVLMEPRKAVLTESTAKKYFGGANPIGQVIRLNNLVDVEVAGIVKDVPATSHLPFTMVVSYSSLVPDFNGGLGFDQWGMVSSGYTYVRLKNAADVQRVDGALAHMVQSLGKEQRDRKLTLQLQPLSDIHFNQTFEQTNPSYTISSKFLMMLFVLAGFILLIACVNYINLSTSLAFAKSKEVGIRKTIGASKWQLFFHYMQETFFVTGLAMITGIGMALLLIPLVNQMLEKAVSGSQLIHPVFISGGFGLLLLISFLSGIYPALILSGFKPVFALKNQMSAPGKTSVLFRKGLVVFQFTTSIALIVCTIVIAEQVNYFTKKELGFNKDAVVEVGLPSNDSTRMQAFRAGLQNQAGIEKLSFCLGAPISENGFNTSLQAPELPANKEYNVQMIPCDSAYFETYGLKLLAGRWFMPGEEKNKGASLVVNETLIKTLGYKTPSDAIGKKVKIGINHYAPAIIGVTKDFHVSSVHEAIAPVALMPFQFFYYAAAIRISPGGLKSTLAGIESAWKKTYPESPYTVRFVDEILAERYEQELRDFNLFKTFSIVSIFICCIGLWGLIAFVVVRKTKEIGIRKVLGASVNGIMLLLSKDFLKLIAIALLVASPIAWYAMNKWLEDFAYRINIEWWVFAAGGLLTLLIALVTISFQAVKAAVANPVKSLRTE